jgi:glycosyltransferase involved in cell wall biosynthesis
MRAAAAGPGAPRVLLSTEATYPYAVGGVSSWCHLLVGGLAEIDWRIVPIHAGARRPRELFELPANASVATRIDVWSERLPRRRLRGGLPPRGRASLAAELARGLIGWRADHAALVETLAWCRRHPAALRPAFRCTETWTRFLTVLRELLDEPHADAGGAPPLDAVDAASLYQQLYWVARVAAAPTPAADLLHVTAAGWAAIPALVHQRLHGTPLLLTEHGVYVREAYLAAARSTAPAGDRFVASRLARGLTMATYAAADVIAPVTEANERWEVRLGVDPARIRVIHNGITPPQACSPPPGALKVVSVGRIDPLKDVQTMLHVAAEVVRRVPGVRFEYWGPPTRGQEPYARACEELRRRLALGDGFRFMGVTSTPNDVVRDADVVLMTSISEGLPMAILEAMAQGRPVVATGVGGVPDVLRGCGVVVPSGDVGGLATAVTTLLRNPVFAARLGARAFARVQERYTQARCLTRYRALFDELLDGARGAEARAA